MKKNDFWWNLPAYVDRWRIFPRVFISVYMYLLYQTVTWFMALDAPTVEQAGLISVIFSVGGFWFNSYLLTPAKKIEELDKNQSGSFKPYNTNHKKHQEELEKNYD